MKIEKNVVSRVMKPSQILDFFNQNDHDYTMHDDNRNIDGLLFQLLNNNANVEVTLFGDTGFLITQDLMTENGFTERISFIFEQVLTVNSCFNIEYKILPPNELNFKDVSFVEMFSANGDLKSFYAELEKDNKSNSKYICEGSKYGGMISSIKSNDIENQEYFAKIDDFYTQIPEIIANTVGQNRHTDNAQYFDELLLKYNAEKRKR